MIDDRTIDKLIERLTNRIQLANNYFLSSIGESIKQIGKLTPSKAQQLVQILKYGDNYQNIIKEISKLTDLNAKEIDKIFEEYAKQDQQFYKKFYEYRNKPFIEYANNEALIRQTKALSNISKGIMLNFTNSSALGYSIRDLEGNITFTGLRQTYERVLDTALLNVGQGKETFDDAMRNILKEIGGSGLRTLDYESGRSIRLDSMVRMHLKDGLRNLHNENQKIIAEEIDADGVEISVHINPAPDHAEVQGRQFTTNQYDKNGKLIKKGEFEKFQNDEKAVSYDGIVFEPEFDGHDRRSISEYNCYHYIFAIVLGVNKPQYSDEELQQIINDNNKGFEIDGKHYTMYEGTQLQRRLETKIREQRDIQILAKTSNNKNLELESQNKIRLLKDKYNQLNAISGLKPKMKRLR